MLTVENQLGNVCHHKHGYFYHYEVNIWIYVFLFQSKHWQKTRLLDQNVDVAVLKLVTSDWNVDHLCHLRNSWILNKDHSSNLHPGDHNMWNNDQFIWKMEGARPRAVRPALPAVRHLRASIFFWQWSHWFQLRCILLTTHQCPVSCKQTLITVFAYHWCACWCFISIILFDNLELFKKQRERES